MTITDAISDIKSHMEEQGYLRAQITHVTSMLEVAEHISPTFDTKEELKAFVWDESDPLEIETSIEWDFVYDNELYTMVRGVQGMIVDSFNKL